MPTDTNTFNTGVDTQEFLGALKDRLLGNAGVVSSQPSNIDSFIQSTVDELKAGREATERGIAAKFERGRIETRESGQNLLTAELESRRGFATNTAALREVVNQNEKSLRDLDLREQEALATGRTELASTIAGLKIKQLEMRTDAEQRVFQNLLAGAGLSLQAEETGIKRAEFGLAQRQQSFVEKQAISQVALSFGVPIREGDTLDTIISRVSPLASEKQKLEIAKMRAEINRANAEAAKAMRGDGGDARFDSLTASILAQAVKDGKLALTNMKTPEQAGQVYGAFLEMSKPRDWSDEEIRNTARSFKVNQKSFTEVSNEILVDPSIKNKDRAIMVAKEVYGITGKSAFDDILKSKPMQGFLKSFDIGK